MITPSSRFNGIDQFALVWAGWLFSQEWWRKELWRDGSPPTWTLDSMIVQLEKEFREGADANNLILQARTWERHDVGTTPGLGSTEKALRSIKVPLLYMPSATDLYFPVEDARVRGGLHSQSHPDADSIALGSHGGRRAQPGRQEIPQ